MRTMFVVAAAAILILVACGDECNFGIDGPIEPEHEVMVWRVYEAVMLHGYEACCRVRLIYSEHDAYGWLQRVDTPCGWSAGTYGNGTASVNMFCYGPEWMPGTMAHEIAHSLWFMSEANAKLFARGVMYHYNQLLEEELHG